MRRWFWAAAAVAGLAASSAQGQYLVIRYYIGGKGDSDKTSGFGPGAGGGFGPGAGGGLAPGGGFGPGAGGTRPGGPGMGGPGMAGPGRGGAGGYGQGGIGYGPGRGGAGAGGAPMGGVGPAGAGGVGPAGAGGVGPAGAGGVGPAGVGGVGPGGAGGFGRGGMGFGKGGTGGGEDLASSVTFEIGEQFVIAAIEVDSLKAEYMHVNDLLGGLRQYKHKWGFVAPFSDGYNIIVTKVDYKSPVKQFADKKRDAMAKRDRSADDMVMLAEWALSHGLLKECVETMDELPKDIAKGSVSAGSERIKAVLAAYQKVKEDLAKPVFGTTAVDSWKKRLPGFGVASSNEGHYVLFFSEQSKDAPPEIARRLAMLEEKMRVFYTWFAFRGKTLPVPEEKLVAIQVQDASSFRSQRVAADDVQPVSDGFYAQRDNVAVFSTNRLDEPYQLFARNLQETWRRGWKRDDLLAGKDAPKDLKKGKASEWKDEFKRCQTLALLDRALENEAEIAAVTHEGTRQLAIASGLYPRSVLAPEWIRFGFASLFDTPKGPYVGVTGAAQTAFWQSCGGPNWAYIRPFRIWADSKDASAKLDEPAVALKRTITDYYFRNSRKEVDEEIDPKLTETERKQKEKEIARAKEEQLRARAQAWALTFFLAKYHTEGLLAYFQELSNQPRDLEMDEQTNVLAFGRSFKVINAAGDGLDDAKVAALAKDWFDKIRTETLPRDPRLEPRKEKQPDQQNQGPGGGPGQPGPGGKPGGGGEGRP
jgi:Protein of unknown function (DUF1570)